MRGKRKGRRLALAACAAAAGLALLGAARYGFRDLYDVLRTGYRWRWMPEGVVPADTSPIHSGHIAVNLLEDFFPRQAAWWSMDEGLAHPLDGVPAESPWSRAVAVNGTGAVVGNLTRNRPGPIHERAFHWSRGQGMTQIRISGAAWIAPTDINDHGQVIGFIAFPLTNGCRAFVWQSGKGARELRSVPPGRETYAVRINEAGWVLGNAAVPDRSVSPVLWKPGSDGLHLDRLPGFASAYGADLNDHGQVLLNYEEPDPSIRQHAYLWTEDAGYRPLPVPSGWDHAQAIAINNHGAVLLWAFAEDRGDPRGFLLRPGGELEELPDAPIGGVIRYEGLDDAGWLVGSISRETASGGSKRGFAALPPW